ncbi:enoyl-CoA hydratase/isomerase family protein [Xanthobacter sp. TB0139]|uniref:enoyl-CoA hydratase/isomerase family protein n=1 Tax=Xanthobacter sp. TB0139 TaxID=3459178 RepID=UPI00403A7AD6
MNTYAESVAPPCLLQVSEGFAVVTLNRPARGNALSSAMVEAMLPMLEDVSRNPDIHTLVLRGQGRHFCSGFDLSDLANETDASLLARMVRIEMLLDALWRLPRRTIAIGQGRVTGAGADLMVACDHRLLAHEASMTFPGARFGLVLGTRRLATRIGADKAILAVSQGQMLKATDAMACGLATALLPEGAAPEDEALWTQMGPLVVEMATFAQLRGALDDKASDTDLAALVRSAARPGLKARIEAYRAAVEAARAESRGRATS